ncbi:Aste57867_709 [Aphanomyces stellatus]|uniref:Aste57867_709 protein n=1 Tax=Aphanomyces stellatus TaxID=120398 RepID=A0A485K3N6_9STRA|nr:hypothetical protein As57867_000708 [Aphanomyces stellatus]VFT77933.1 Aste57867_709 [Aphanomyces stellatus]
MSDESFNASAEISAAQCDGRVEVETEPPEKTVSWLEHHVTTRRCRCPRCVYARPRQTEMPDEYECRFLLGHRRCRERFPSNELLVVHQLECHETVYPICPKQWLNMQNNVDFSSPKPPPTVYIYQQWDNPILPPELSIDVDAEHERVNREHPPETIGTKRKRKGYSFGMEKMRASHAEPMTAMYDIFVDACARWLAGDEYEKKAQHEEAMMFYLRSKEHPARDVGARHPLVGHGRNWFKQ